MEVIDLESLLCIIKNALPSPAPASLAPIFPLLAASVEVSPMASQDREQTDEMSVSDFRLAETNFTRSRGMRSDRRAKKFGESAVSWSMLPAT